MLVSMFLKGKEVRWLARIVRVWFDIGFRSEFVVEHDCCDKNFDEKANPVVDAPL